MNKSELAQALATKADISKADAQKAVDAIFSPEDGVITDALRQGDRVQITGFGTFEPVLSADGDFPVRHGRLVVPGLGFAWYAEV